jgi:uncharacterized protein
VIVCFVRIWRVTALAALAALALAAAACSGPAAAPTGRAAFQSLYVPMRDGIRVAVDVWLPAGTTAGSRLPTVLVTTRYWRERESSPGMAAPWNARGYAYVVADLRGSGASFGTIKAELGSAMIADVGTLSDWIAGRPWSDGRVGVTGVSYSGDTAMLSLALRNHHITAAAPISYDFDPYEYLVRPGGVLVEPVIAPYSILLRILDEAGGTTCATSAATRRICAEDGLTGAEPEPVGGPHGQALLKAARTEHFGNVNLVDFAKAAVFRNDVIGAQSWPVTSVGPKSAAIQAGRVPILTFAGWLDAGVANGVLSQFMGLSNTQEDWIGPWNHGEGYIAYPFKPSRPLTSAERQQLNDALYAFFDRYVKHAGRPDGRRLLHYYTLNEGRWRTTTRFPVAGTQMRRLYLADKRMLTWQQSAAGAPSSDLLTLNKAAGTGRLDRWHTNFDGGPVIYPNRAAVDRKLLAYTSPPLRSATRLTGFGHVTLEVTGGGGASNGALYAYLEDVTPDGRVTYITEGELALADRATAPERNNPAWRKLSTPRTYARTDASPFPLGRARQVTFDLLPTSVLFHAGDRIRITIAAADPDSFQLLPADGKASYRIGHSITAPSYVELPVVR